MEKNNIHRHCPEVENLMDGRMPLVTRCGITIVTLIILVIVVFSLLLEETSQWLMKEMIKHSIEQITNKI